jgi:hypothetical protein
LLLWGRGEQAARCIGCRSRSSDSSLRDAR